MPANPNLSRPTAHEQLQEIAAELSTIGSQISGLLVNHDPGGEMIGLYGFTLSLLESAKRWRATANLIYAPAPARSDRRARLSV